MAGYNCILQYPKYIYIKKKQIFMPDEMKFRGITINAADFPNCDILKEIIRIHEDLYEELEEITQRKIDLEAQTHILAYLIETYIN